MISSEFSISLSLPPFQCFLSLDYGIGFHQGPTATLNASIKSSLHWQEFAIYTLDYPHRTSGDPEYTAFVDHIGEDHSYPETSLQHNFTIASFKSE
jgi:hypothetical protein